MEPGDERWPCLRAHEQGVTLAVKVSPNASRTAPKGLKEGRLHVRLQAPPVEGKANRALLKWCAGVFGVRAREIALLHGERAAEKVLLIKGLSIASARKALTQLDLT